MSRGHGGFVRFALGNRPHMSAGAIKPVISLIPMSDGSRTSI